MKLENYRIQLKHDSEENWNSALDFIPLNGEVVVYNADEFHSEPRIKIGNGTDFLQNLSFIETIKEIKPDENGNYNFIIHEQETGLYKIPSGTNIYYNGTEGGKYTTTPYEQIIAITSPNSNGLLKNWKTVNTSGPDGWIIAGCIYENGPDSSLGEYFQTDLKQLLHRHIDSDIEAKYTFNKIPEISEDTEKLAAGDNSTKIPNTAWVQGELENLSLSGGGIADQSYNATSENAQSGKAVAEAFSNLNVKNGEGDNSIVEGHNTVASGPYGTHAEGSGTEASGSSAHAEGTHSIASGFSAHAEGHVTNALGDDGAHSEGYYTVASSNATHSEGYCTIASGQFAHSEGFYTKASGRAAHSEGNYTEASNDATHAQGDRTKASGDCSSAAGSNTIAGYSHQFVIGKYNENKEDNLFEIGDGHPSYISNNGGYKVEELRQNVFEVTINGTANVRTTGTNTNSITTRGFVEDQMSSAVSEAGENAKSLINTKLEEFAKEIVGHYGIKSYLTTNTGLLETIGSSWAGNLESSTMYVVIHGSGENNIKLSTKKNGTVADTLAADGSAIPAFQSALIIVPKGVDEYFGKTDWYEKKCLVLGVMGKNALGIPNFDINQFYFWRDNLPPNSSSVTTPTAKDPNGQYFNTGEIYFNSLDSGSFSIWKVKI